MAAITLADIRTALAGLNGESSSPNDTSRDYHINRIVEDLYYMQQWNWRRATATVSFNGSGVGTAPANYTLDSFPDPEQPEKGDLREVVSGGSDIIYSLIEYVDRDSYGDGDNVVWITGNEVDGYSLNIHETDSPSLLLTYYRKKDTLSAAGDTTYIPLLNPIAIGAYAYLVRGDQDDRNNTKEWRDYLGEIDKLTAFDTRQTSMRLRSTSEKRGYYIGMI